MLFEAFRAYWNEMIADEYFMGEILNLPGVVGIG